jgi:hypothetical protein
MDGISATDRPPVLLPLPTPTNAAASSASDSTAPPVPSKGQPLPALVFCDIKGNAISTISATNAWTANSHDIFVYRWSRRIRWICWIRQHESWIVLQSCGSQSYTCHCYGFIIKRSELLYHIIAYYAGDCFCRFLNYGCVCVHRWMVIV